MEVYSVQTSLEGHHFNFTVVHEPPYIDDGLILDKSLWSGLVIDMINQFASQSGFTFELFLPSGLGPTCIASSSVATHAYATQYICGQEDALTLNQSDGYWSLYYITESRLQSGTIFTLPYLTDQGLGILTKPAQRSFLNEITLIFTPFSPNMWFITICVVLFASVIVYLQEVLVIPKRHAHNMAEQFLQSINRKDAADYESLIESDELQGGRTPGIFNTMDSAKKYSTYFLGTFSGLMSASDNSSEGEEQVRPTGTFATPWLFFVLFWASAYTANLAAKLTLDSSSPNIASLEDMNRRK